MWENIHCFQRDRICSQAHVATARGHSSPLTDNLDNLQLHSMQCIYTILTMFLNTELFTSLYRLYCHWTVYTLQIHIQTITYNMSVYLIISLYKLSYVSRNVALFLLYIYYLCSIFLELLSAAATLYI